MFLVRINNKRKKEESEENALFLLFRGCIDERLRAWAFRSWFSMFAFLALLLTSCVIVEKLLNNSGLSFPTCQMDMMIISIMQSYCDDQ